MPGQNNNAAELINAINRGFRDVHERLDEFVRIQNEHTTNIALLKRDIPTQPCPQFKEHVKDHPHNSDLQILVENSKEIKKGFHEIFVEVVKVALTALLGAAAAIFSLRLHK